MPCNNTAIIAAAGSGKTTELISRATNSTDNSILLLTYTIANVKKLHRDIEKKCGIIPQNIEISTWHSFLLRHCIRPFRSAAWPMRIDRIDFDSSIRNFYIPENNTGGYYFSSSDSLYKDRASKFALKCNSLTGNAVIQRLEKIYDSIYIDEVQDMAGEDIDIVKLLCQSTIKMTVVGDIRQAIYFTCNARKNKGNRGSKLLQLFRTWEKEGIIQIEFRDFSYRCKQCVCDLSDSLFPSIDEKTISRNEEKCEHEGIYIVRSKNLFEYCTKFNLVILQWNVRAKVPDDCMNFTRLNIGLCKGATYDHVVIICTSSFMEFVKNNKLPDKEKTKSELYVAISRAKFSVAFLYDGKTYDSNIYQVYD